MEHLQPVIKWSGSKRSQAKEICGLFPDQYGTYFEPFLGGGSILGFEKPQKAVCGDVCEPLISLWNVIKAAPKDVAKRYKQNWSKLQADGPDHYYVVRDSFNKSYSPHDLLFLSRTCVNGLIRFNKDGEFNNSFHLSRKGIQPDRLEKILMAWSRIISAHEFVASDYRETTSGAKKGDLVYLDPPYFHTKGRYYGGIHFDDFVEYLIELNKRGVYFALSFDGTRGEKEYSVEIPSSVFKRKVMLHSGNSTFNKVQRVGVQPVFESLYLNY